MSLARLGGFLESIGDSICLTAIPSARRSHRHCDVACATAIKS